MQDKENISACSPANGRELPVDGFKPDAAPEVAAV